MSKQPRVAVMLVEDDPWLAESEAAVLTKAGFTVATFSNALEAMDGIDEAVPDVLVLDVLLTGSTVFALLNELQSHDDTKKIPVVLCTNLAEQFSRSQLGAYNVKRVVDKTTMHPDDLVAAVRSSVDMEGELL